MLSLRTILGFGITFFCLSVADHTFIRYKRQAQLMKQYGENFEVVYPFKVNEDGDHLSYDVRHYVRRSRRSLPPPVNDKSRAVHYRLALSGSNVTLQLVPNNAVLAPGFVIETKRSPRNNDTRRNNTIALVGNGKHCLFHGHILGFSSQVALTTCNGLAGLIRNGDEEYFIEPVLGHEPRPRLSQPHLLYKRSTAIKHSHVTGTCGTKADDVLQNTAAPIMKSKVSLITKKLRTSRTRRSVSVERNVETLIVADKSMVDYYSDEDITTYILTIVNMVSALYHDASIGNAINIILVRVMLLGNDEEEKKDGLLVTKNADDTLKSFCRWQKFINPKGEKHPNHHDVAILLTRLNICTKTDEPCSTLGLAEVAGMCQPQRSCNVNEDTGLALAFTIAHEMGHNFGMSHDSLTNGCQTEEEKQYVMSPHLNAEASPFSWSNCSRNAITKFLDHDWGSCLDDEPSDQLFSFPDLPPGALYDTDHQCRLQYGLEASFCKGMQDVCQTLWCKHENKCVTRLEPAAEGTLCGHNKWCYMGKCTQIGDREQSIDGEWGSWSPWSDCSRTCGAGVMQSERICNNPLPSWGGRYCLGERKRYKICNIEKCPENTPSFRESQCAAFNSVPYKGELHSWLPVLIPMTPCQLHCKPKGQFFSVMLSDIVKDATECNPGSRDICINGKCKKVSCDWGIESSAKEDRCGVCHGDGSQCKVIKGIFDRKVGAGYVDVVVVPKGAMNVKVEEIAEATNYIAAQSEKGEFYLNGQWFIQWSGEYMAAGTKLYYHREGEKEKIHVPGPLKANLRILLLYQTENPGVIYEYTQVDKNSTRATKFYWEYEDWTVCSATCGGGKQLSKPVCLEIEAGLVEDKYCNASQKLSQKSRDCNKHHCPPRWWTGPWQHCSVSCGGKGVRRRGVICVRSIGQNEQIALADADCKDKEKPKDRETCNKKRPCHRHLAWDIEQRGSSDCDKERCKSAIDCDILKENCKKRQESFLSKKDCTINDTCGNWIVGNWSQCSVSCGTGIQKRHVKCVNLMNQAAATDCPAHKQANNTKSCVENPCL